MGAIAGKDDQQLNSFQQILKQYEKVPGQSNCDVTILRNIINQSQYAELRQLKYVVEEEYEQKYKILEKARTVVHPSLIRIYGIHKKKVESFCSTTFTINILNEKPICQMPQYLYERGSVDFSEKELCFILQCIVEAQIVLIRTNNMPKSLSFQDIYLCQGKSNPIWKLAPYELIFDQYQYTPALELLQQRIRNQQNLMNHIYAAPEEIEFVHQQLIIPEQDNQQKSSVFTLGLIFLHISLGEACDDLYDYEQISFKKDVLKEKLDDLLYKYSSNYAFLIRDMLQIQINQRLDYNQIYQRLTQEKAKLEQAQASRELKNSQIQLVDNYSRNENLFITGKKPSQGSIVANIQAINSPVDIQAINPFQVQQMFVTPQSIAKSAQSQLFLGNQENYGHGINELDDPVKVNETYQNGSRYQGEKLGGMRNGYGRMEFAEGGYYEGQWKDNAMEGKGVLYYDNSNKAYEGYFKEGKFNNFGHLYNKFPSNDNSSFDFRKFKMLGDKWIKYEGDFQFDKKHGIGVLYLNNGEKYVGSFKDDYIHGYGGFQKFDGTTINGYWEYSTLLRLV